MNKPRKSAKKVAKKSTVKKARKTKKVKKAKKLDIKKLAAKNPRLKARLAGKKHYTKRMTFFKRESELGNNLTSKFLKVIHDKLGRTRVEIAQVLVAKGALAPVITKGKVNITKTAQKLNFAFDGMQKKNLIRKEEFRNKETNKIQTRNCPYSLTDEGKKIYRAEIEPKFRKWIAA